MSRITFVTALVDIKREDLQSSAFQRSFQRYLDVLSRLLINLVDKNLVIYIEEENRQFVQQFKTEGIIFKDISCDWLRQTEYYKKIQKVRGKEGWKNQVGWLSQSTQACLELYNPLIFQKIHFLDDTSKENPFNSEFFVWIDAGIANAQAHPSYFSKPWFEERLIPKLQKFLFLCFPYANFQEIHGFNKEGMFKFCKTKLVDRVARATFFGGRKEQIHFLTKQYQRLAHETLNRGFMGTEESLFTILTYLYEDQINIEMIQRNGLVSSFFEDLQNEEEAKNYMKKLTIGNGSFSYLGTRIQQNPNVFTIFEEFFSRNQFDQVMEIGTGFGGLSMFLKDQSDKMGAKFITFEISEQKKMNLLANIEFVNRNIDIRVGDIFNEDIIETIGDLISQYGRTLILCDGGNKIREFNIFSDFLKSGDVIMAHDFARDGETFEAEIKDTIWNWLEIQERDIRDCCNKNNLEDYFDNKFEEIAWCCKIKSYQKKTDLYILTFNSPTQFERLAENIIEASSDMFEHSDKYVLNNSTDRSTDEKYRKLFKKYNFTEFKKDNIGICGGRQFIADHFSTTSNKYMIFFEDDMQLNCLKTKNQTCKNGFKKYHKNLYKDILRIMNKEGYDFLKLSFTEFYGDNSTQWAWYNVLQDKREEYWPEYSKLPEHGLDKNSPKTVFKNIKSLNGLPYADGEIYYSNWPQIITKEANKKMFLDTRWAHPFEQIWMSHFFQMTKRGELNPAILLLSPIEHDRFDNYDSYLRKES